MATPQAAPTLQLQSSARVHSPYARIILFGEQDAGKTMTIPTAPSPVWLLTEATRIESLTRENIIAVYGPPPDKEQILTFLKKEDPKLKGKELDAAVAEIVADPSLMTGITYDVPRIDIPDYDVLQKTLDWLRSPAAEKFETVFIDSASMANKMVLDHHLNKKTKSGNQADGRLAYGKSGKETYKWFEDLYTLPKHLVFICHASEFQHNIGTAEEPVWVRELFPTFHGNFLKRESHHLFSNILQVVKGKKLPDGKILHKDDSGKSIRMLKCRPDTPKGVERTLCTRLQDQEETNLTALFGKLTAKS